MVLNKGGGIMKRKVQKVKIEVTKEQLSLLRDGAWLLRSACFLYGHDESDALIDLHDSLVLLCKQMYGTDESTPSWWK